MNDDISRHPRHPGRRRGARPASCGLPTPPRPPPATATGGSATCWTASARLEREAGGALADLAVGGEQDLHDAVLAVEMESIAFELAVQMRNRLVEAYQEIFRMSV